MGPLQADKPWSDDAVNGAFKFLDRVYRLYTESGIIKDEPNINLDKIYNQTVKKVTEDYESLNFNTAISAMMIFINAVYKENIFPKEYALNFIKLLNPIAAHITEELWEILGNNNTITYESWPVYDINMTKDDTYTMVVQVNGKLRDQIEVAVNTDIDTMEALALSSTKVKNYINDKEIIKVIKVPNKLVNIVIKG